MKKINRLIKECIVEVLSENINRDPTKDEMIQFLNKKFGRWELANIDVEGAMYWFANFYHGGWSFLPCRPSWGVPPPTTRLYPTLCGLHLSWSCCSTWDG